MADDVVRTLERRWRATQDPLDEAAFHAARVRAGVLHPSRLALAAALGRRGAAPIGAEPARWPDDPSAWGRLFQVALLIAPDDQARARALVILAGTALAALARERDVADLAFVRQALALEHDELAAVAGLLVRAIRTGELLRQELPTVQTHGHRSSLPRWVSWTSALAGATRIEVSAHTAPAAPTAFMGSLWPITANAAEARFGADATAWARAVREALEAGLAPWALGEEDPIDTPGPRFTPPAEAEVALREVHTRSTTT